MRNLYKYVIILFICFSLSCKKDTATKEIAFAKEAEVNIYTRDGQEYTFAVEIAQTEYERVRGLMYRYRLEQNQGMFFIFDSMAPQSFWMKNTYISLDMLFIDEEMNIVYIHENAFPLSEEAIHCEVPVRYVLEILGGISKKFNIVIGDKVSLVR